MGADILKTISNLPIVRKALGEEAAELVRLRQKLLDERAKLVADAQKRREFLYLKRQDATICRVEAEAAYFEALRNEIAASTALDGHSHTTDRDIAKKDGSLLGTAGAAGKECAEVVRQLRDAHSMLRKQPIATVTTQIERVTRDGDRRKEIVPIGDTRGRAAELRALLDATREVEKLPLQVADPTEISAWLAEFRTKFGLPAKTEAAA